MRVCVRVRAEQAQHPGTQSRSILHLPPAAAVPPPLLLLPDHPAAAARSVPSQRSIGFRFFLQRVSAVGIIYFLRLLSVRARERETPCGDDVTRGRLAQSRFVLRKRALVSRDADWPAAETCDRSLPFKPVGTSACDVTGDLVPVRWREEESRRQLGEKPVVNKDPAFKEA